MSQAKMTDHGEVKRWAEERDGHPSVVRMGGRGGVPRVDFGEPKDKLEKTSWEEVFKIVEESPRALLRQEKTVDGRLSRFRKFIERAHKKH